MCKLPRITSICHIGRPISQWQSIRCLIYICGMDDYGRKNGLYIGLFQRIHLRRAGSLLLYICFWLTSSCSGTPELVDIALRFFYSGVHPCLLLIGGKYSACLLTRFIFSAALYRDIHSYRSHFFVMKSFLGYMAITAYSLVIKHGKFALSTSHLYHGSFLPHQKPPFLLGFPT